MTQEEKFLLLQDLSTRLPCGLLFMIPEMNEPVELLSIKPKRDKPLEIDDGHDENSSTYWNLEDVKPYLRPLSSMTEEEKEELLNLLFDKEAKYFYIDKEGLIDGRASFLMKEGLNYPAFCPINVEIYTDYLNSHHFDWRIDNNGRTLIEKGLALEAPKDMYKTK